MTCIGIVGARKYKDRQSVIELVHSLPRDSTVITSSCRGVCTWAGEAAKAAGFKVLIYAPDLNGIHNRTEMVERYYQRNRQLISACEIVHAFISQEDGLTGGTRYEGSVRQTSEQGIGPSLGKRAGATDRPDIAAIRIQGKRLFSRLVELLF